jgi:hypothetical protein
MPGMALCGLHFHSLRETTPGAVAERRSLGAASPADRTDQPLREPSMDPRPLRRRHPKCRAGIDRTDQD